MSAEQLRQTAALHTITKGRPVESTLQHWRIDLRAQHHPRDHVQAAALALGPAMALDATAEIRTRIIDHGVTVRGADGTAYTRIGPTHTEATVPADFRSREGPRELLALRRIAARRARSLKRPARRRPGVLLDGNAGACGGVGVGDGRGLS